ncbi:MAG: FAD-dependent monooxygenase, partial [Parvibaculaceae bacterium]
DGIVATVDGLDGACEIAARFIVGCDGGNSLVRRLAGIGLDDLGFDEPWLVIDTTLKNGRERLSTVGLQHCDPRRPVTSMPMAPGRHRWEFMLLPGETPESVMSDETIAGFLAPYAEAADLEIERRAVYRFHALIADKWRDGPVILAGDAAHQMPPFMGQGLCSGVRDAANISWKIEAVLRGRAGDALLDSYQPEREPHVRMITDMAVMMGKVVCTRDPEEARARDDGMLAQPEAQRQNEMMTLEGLKSGTMPGAGGIFPDPGHGIGHDQSRLDDAAGCTAILVVAQDCDASRAFAASGGFVSRVDALPDAEGHLARLMDGAPAVLVRPDRYVFGTGETGALVAAWEAYLASGKAAAPAAAA